MADNWTETKWSGLVNYECADCAFATLEPDLIVRHAVHAHGARPRTAAKKVGALAGIDFASDEASEAAIASGLNAAHFDFPPSGKTGFTVADVRRAAEAEPTQE